jgi:hypothetical protein
MNAISKPLWVQIGLWGIKSRTGALGWFYSSIFGSLLLGGFATYYLASFTDTQIVISIFMGICFAIIFATSSLWYGLCIYWMDSNRAWGK